MGVYFTQDYVRADFQDSSGTDLVLKFDPGDGGGVRTLTMDTSTYGTRRRNYLGALLVSGEDVGTWFASQISGAWGTWTWATGYVNDVYLGILTPSSTPTSNVQFIDSGTTFDLHSIGFLNNTDLIYTPASSALGIVASYAPGRVFYVPNGYYYRPVAGYLTTQTVLQDSTVTRRSQEFNRWNFLVRGMYGAHVYLSDAANLNLYTAVPGLQFKDPNYPFEALWKVLDKGPIRFFPKGVSGTDYHDIYVTGERFLSDLGSGIKLHSSTPSIVDELTFSGIEAL